MLPSSVGNQEKPYVDDHRKRKGEGGSPGNYGVGRRRANEDYQSRDDHEFIHKEEASQIHQGELRHFRLEPRRHARHIPGNYPTQVRCESKEKVRPVETTSVCPRNKLGNNRRSK